MTLERLGLRGEGKEKREKKRKRFPPTNQVIPCPSLNVCAVRACCVCVCVCGTVVPAGRLAIRPAQKLSKPLSKPLGTALHVLSLA